MLMQLPTKREVNTMKLTNSKDLTAAIKKRKAQLTAKKSATPSTSEKKKEGGRR